MADFHSEDGRIKYMPEGFSLPPANILDALRVGRAILAEDGRWLTGSAYALRDPDHPDAMDTPYCDNWGVCAVGALQVAIIGLSRMTSSTGGCSCPACVSGWVGDTSGTKDETELYIKTVRRLDKAANHLYGHSSIIGLNDGYDKTQESLARVLACFDDAITMETAAQTLEPAS